MVQISEANLSNAMKFAFNRFIEPLDTEHLLAYRPLNQSEDWIKDNPTTGVVYLKKHPNAKEAWLLVKFEMTEPEYGTSTVPQQRKTIRTKEEFIQFFDCSEPKFWVEDIVIMVSWDKQKVTNKNPKRDFDETTPNFYRYGNHLSVSLDKAVKGMYRINEIIEKTGSVGNLFKIPYSYTNFK